MQRISIINSDINITSMFDVINQLEESILNSRKSEYICVSNVHTTVMGKRNLKFREITNNSYMSVPDGMPLVWYGRLAGCKKITKCSGPDLMIEMFKISEEKGFTNFFYGGTDETLRDLSESLQKKYPDLKIAGMCAPPFRPLSPEEDKKIIEEINKLDPDIIWVGLGAPKQEIWMAEHVDKIKSSVLIGVGAAFNFHAGTVKRAPRWMQETGLEWLYRLVQEPGRLWKRYLVTNSLFIFYVLMDYIKNAVSRKPLAISNKEYEKPIKSEKTTK